MPAGQFLTGSGENDDQASDAEKPQHLVRVGHRIAIGRYPVTFEEYDDFGAGTPRRDPPDDEGWGAGRRPVIDVSWHDAQAYVEWLASETGQPHRPPSEAEWEYACRAGMPTRYRWGDEDHAGGGELWAERRK